MLRSALRIAGILTVAAAVSGSVVVLAPGRAVAKTRDCTPRPAANLAGCNYSGADLLSANFAGSDLRGANLSGADLNAADFTNANLRFADLQGAGIALDCDTEQCPGVSGFFTHRFEVGPNFTGANLHGANLAAVTLEGGTFNVGPPICLPPGCFQPSETYTAATLTGVKSGGVSGPPGSLPSGWELIDGYLTVPPPALLIARVLNPPTATHGVPYSAFLAIAAGGVPPYKWKIASGMLPQGLHLQPQSGMISGTPKSAGLSQFTIEVTDTKTHQPTTQRTQSLLVSLQIT